MITPKQRQAIDQGIFQQIQEPIRNEKVSVGITSSVIAEARNQNNPRKSITIRNISSDATKIITINFGQNVAVADNGIVLRQYESVTDSSESGYQCFQGTITAIAAVAGEVAIMER